MIAPSLVLSWALALAPRTSHARAEALAQAITSAAHTREDAAELLTTAFVETSFRAGRVPFGLTCRSCREAARALDTAAVRALAILRAGRACGSRARAFAHYRLGRCADDPEGARRARIVARLLAHR